MNHPLVKRGQSSNSEGKRWHFIRILENFHQLSVIFSIKFKVPGRPKNELFYLLMAHRGGERGGKCILCNPDPIMKL